MGCDPSTKSTRYCSRLSEYLIAMDCRRASVCRPHATGEDGRGFEVWIGYGLAWYVGQEMLQVPADRLFRENFHGYRNNLRRSTSTRPRSTSMKPVDALHKGPAVQIGTDVTSRQGTALVLSHRPLDTHSLIADSMTCIQKNMRPERCCKHIARCKPHTQPTTGEGGLRTLRAQRYSSCPT